MIATPQKAPKNAQNDTRTLPISFGALSRYPRKCAIHRGNLLIFGGPKYGLICLSKFTLRFLRSDRCMIEVNEMCNPLSYREIRLEMKK